MDATPPAPPDSAGELIVHNGRLIGTRKALGPALTLLGRAEGCDVRLNVEGVHPVHCAIVRGPDGILLRTLHGAITHRNGEPIGEVALHDGDLIAVGPFQFRVALGPLSEPLQREKDALRIQAAAVAAQQAAPDRGGGASSASPTRPGTARGPAIDSIWTSAAANSSNCKIRWREARMALRNERAEHEKRIAETTTELLNTRRDINSGQEKLRGERRQLTELHRRLRQRYAQHSKAAEAAMRQREEQLGQERTKLDSERSALHGVAVALQRRSGIGTAATARWLGGIAPRPQAVGGKTQPR